MRLKASRRVLPPLFAAVLAACGRGDPAGAHVVERDSAGIRIVETPAGAAAAVPRWTLGDRPEGAIGTAASGAAIDLFRVRGALRLGDGRIAVANSGTGELLVYDPRDESVERFGRKGRGPGEFEGIASMWRAGGDTLHVYDMQLARVTPFAPGRGLLSPIGIPAGDASGLLSLRGRLADGAFVALVVPGYAGTHAPGVNDDSATVARVTETGAVHPFARLLFSQTYVHGPEGGSVAALPFGSGGLLAVGRTAVHAAETADFEIVEYGIDGRPRRVIRRDVEPRPVRSADIERAKASDGSDRARTERLFAEMPIPRHHPVLARMAAGRDGHLWVAETVPDPADPTPWSVFDREGRMVGRLETPARFLLLDAGADYLLGVQRDRDDVESVAWYRLERG